MEHKSETNPEKMNLMSKNHSIHNCFLDHTVTKNNPSKVKLGYCEAPFVVEWQMEHNEKEISAKLK